MAGTGQSDYETFSLKMVYAALPQEKTKFSSNQPYDGDYFVWDICEQNKCYFIEDGGTNRACLTSKENVDNYDANPAVNHQKRLIHWFVQNTGSIFYFLQNYSSEKNKLQTMYQRLLTTGDGQCFYFAVLESIYKNYFRIFTNKANDTEYFGGKLGNPQQFVGHLENDLKLSFRWYILKSVLLPFARAFDDATYCTIDRGLVNIVVENISSARDQISFEEGQHEADMLNLKIKINTSLKDAVLEWFKNAGLHNVNNAENLFTRLVKSRRHGDYERTGVADVMRIICVFRSLQAQKHTLQQVQTMMIKGCEGSIADYKWHDIFPPENGFSFTMNQFQQAGEIDEKVYNSYSLRGKLCIDPYQIEDRKRFYGTVKFYEHHDQVPAESSIHTFEICVYYSMGHFSCVTKNLVTWQQIEAHDWRKKSGR